MRFNETPAIAIWTTRVALFSVCLTLVALLAHRFGPMPTLTAFNVLLIAFSGAAVALLLGLISAAYIWRAGCAGGVRTAFGIATALGLLLWPLAFFSSYKNLPAINDVTTDTAAPPKFAELVKMRGSGSNTPNYPVTFAKLQAEAYPDLKPMLIDRSAEETYEIAREALFRQKVNIVHEQAPEGTKPGLIEAVDRTLVFGLYDDIAIRVEGDANHARIDLRSASRFGRHDLGRNAERMRRLMREIVARLEATIPSATGESYVKWRKRPRPQVVKNALENVQKKGEAARKEAREGKAPPKSSSKRNRNQE